MTGLENTAPIQPQIVIDNLRKLPDPEEVQILTAFINLKLKKGVSAIQTYIFNEFSNASGQHVIDQFRKEGREVKRNDDNDMNIDRFEFKAKDGTYKIDSDDKINEDEETTDDYNKSANPMNHRK